VQLDLTIDVVVCNATWTTRFASMHSSMPNRMYNLAISVSFAGLLTGSTTDPAVDLSQVEVSMWFDKNRVKSNNEIVSSSWSRWMSIPIQVDGICENNQPSFGLNVSNSLLGNSSWP
jgi:hypothetical protein